MTKISDKDEPEGQVLCDKGHRDNIEALISFSWSLGARRLYLPVWAASKARFA